MKEQLLPRVRPHPAEEQAQVGELLPAVAGHLGDERALAVHHLVVRQRQHEALGEGVPERERELVVVVAAVDRIVRGEVERVVHPAHVPFHVEAETAAKPGATPRATRWTPRRSSRVGILAPTAMLSCFRNRRLEVLPAAVSSGSLARLASVFEVEHRGHGSTRSASMW